MQCWAEQSNHVFRDSILVVTFLLMVHVLVTIPTAYYTALVDRNKADRIKFAFDNNTAGYRI